MMNCDFTILSSHRSCKMTFFRNFSTSSTSTSPRCFVFGSSMQADSPHVISSIIILVSYVYSIFGFSVFFHFFFLAVSSYYNSSFYFLALQSRGSGPKFSASLFPAKHFSQGRRLASVHMNLHHFVCQVELNLNCPCSTSSFFLFIYSLFTNI